MHLTEILAEVAENQKFKVLVELANGEKTGKIYHKPDLISKTEPILNSPIKLIAELIKDQNNSFELKNFRDIVRFHISSVPEDKSPISDSFDIVQTIIQKSKETIPEIRIEIFYKNGGGAIKYKEISDLENQSDETRNSIIDNILSKSFTEFFNSLSSPLKKE